jgi:hypothetical protein
MNPFVSRLATAGGSAPSSADVVDATSRGGLVRLAAIVNRTTVSASQPIDHHNDPVSGEVKNPKTAINPTARLVQTRATS